MRSSILLDLMVWRLPTFGNDFKAKILHHVLGDIMSDYYLIFYDENTPHLFHAVCYWQHACFKSPLYLKLVHASRRFGKNFTRPMIMPTEAANADILKVTIVLRIMVLLQLKAAQNYLSNVFCAGSFSL
jgi:hypothetical protein